jgi:hypothetical protein
MGLQGEFHFDADSAEDGYGRWLLGRRMAVEILARKMNLPLGHPVEVWLYGGVRLRGVLRLKEEALFIEEDRVRHLELKVDDVPFAYREMESCVRLDSALQPKHDSRHTQEFYLPFPNFYFWLSIGSRYNVTVKRSW